MTIGWLLFTDLNGTLLDDGSSRIDPALPALKTLRRLGIPLIPVTSKTLAEAARLRHALQLTGPLVAELGGQFSHCYMPFTVNHFGGDASPAIAL